MTMNDEPELIAASDAPILLNPYGVTTVVLIPVCTCRHERKQHREARENCTMCTCERYEPKLLV